MYHILVNFCYRCDWEILWKIVICKETSLAMVCRKQLNAPCNDNVFKFLRTAKKHYEENLNGGDNKILLLESMKIIVLAIYVMIRSRTRI